MEYNKRLYEACEQIVKRHNELSKQLETTTIPRNELTNINRQLKRNLPVVNKFLQYKAMINDAKQDEEMLSKDKDPEMQSLAKSELEAFKIDIPKIEEEIKVLLLPVDPNNDKNVIIEMRPAAGGDEASIFVADLFDTYKRYADKQG
jgi:peptide chain release factor 1